MRVSPGSALGPQEWDRALLRQPSAGLLQSWHWGELQARFGWRIERLAFDDGAGGVCSLQLSSGVLPGTTIAYVPRGPVVAAAAGQAALEAIESKTRADTVLRIEPPAPPEDPWVALLEGRARHGYELAKSIESQSESRLQFHVASLYPILYRLERKGLVERRTDPSDRRTRVVHLTAAGRKLIACAFADHERAMEIAASGLNRSERAETIALLKKMGLRAQELLSSGAGK